MTGRVYLIGAGPGDPDLITVKGLAALRRADVVLYDRLAPAELLAEARPEAELIDVGKAPLHHRRSQDEINALLIEHALAGRTVARLKGGDPFVFGRGGEECQALSRAGIGFEVIPGVSSAFAVPAYAGIPLTQRGVNTGFTVLTGHSLAEGGLDWDSVPAAGTLVLLMGVENLAPITAELIRRGRDPHTPAAVIQNGTTRAQRTITGPLFEIAALAFSVAPPAITVIGEVVGLREEIGWFIEETVDGRNADPVSA